MADIPTHHFKDMTLPNCILIAAAEAGTNIDALAHAFLEAHWRDDADLTNLDTLTSAAQGTAYDLAPFVEAAHSDAVKAIYEGNTVEAIRRSVFGSPTYFVDGDMFYGQDRLELVERTLKQPFK